MAATLFNLETEERFDLPPVATLGRRRECAVFLPDQRVSRQHAIVRLQSDNQYWITDLGSFNGSFVNGQRVTTNRKLRDGDLVKVGGFQLRFDYPEQDHSDVSEDVTTHLTIEDIRNIDAIMLVSDIYSFTRISEKLAPNDLAQVVGSFYKACNEIMEKHHGTIDKFIGDAVLAYWPETTQANRTAALNAALSLIDSAEEIGMKYADLLRPSEMNFRVGVGIHAGPTVLSPVAGGIQTILGDAVNLTFRLEALSRPLGKSLLLSEDLVKDWGPDRPPLLDCGEHSVKGREGLLRVFTLENSSADNLPPPPPTVPHPGKAPK